MANRIWLEADLTYSYIPKIERLTDTPQGHTAAKRLLQLMRDNWANEHGLKETRQQQGCIDQVRRTIKEVLDEGHWSLDFIKFSTEEYVQLNDLKQDRVARRNEAVRLLDNPDAIVATAVRLLKSPEWADIAAGLAVLTGRRVSELLATAQFTPKTKWSVLFSGAVKRGKESGLCFEIPTLTTAQNVCEALAKIRLELPQAQEISTQAVNATFEPAVIRACNKHFAGLVPTREGKDTLYTHIFRAVYATIATFWYCPLEVNEIEFRAAIQGHFQILNESRSTLRRSLAASRHYSDYEIADSVIAQYQGKRKGIKLGIAGIEVIEMFQDAVIRGTMLPEKGRGKTTASVRIWKEDKGLLEALFDRLALDRDGRQEDRMRALLEWLDDNLPLAGATAEPPAVQEDEDSMETTTALVPEAVIAQPLSTPYPEPDPLRADLHELIAVLKLQLQHGMMASSTPSHQQSIDPTLNQPPLVLEKKQTKSLKERKNSTKPETIARLNHAIDAIFAWNNAPGRLHDQKWAITLNALKSWSQSAPTIHNILQERKTEIDHHHSHHEIDPNKHNYRHRGKQHIQNVITVVSEDTSPSYSLGI